MPSYGRAQKKDTTLRKSVWKHLRIVTALLATLFGGAAALILGNLSSARADRIGSSTATSVRITNEPSGHSRPCDGDSLSISTADRDAAAGNDGVDLILQNKGTYACTMRGYADIQARRNGKPLKIRVTHNGGMLVHPGRANWPSVQTVTLAPGRDAYIAIQWGQGGGYTPCPTITQLLITPPNGRTPSTVATVSFLYVCYGHIDETPVAATPILQRR